MLEEILLLEEEDQNFELLFLLGVAVALIGFYASRVVFPSEVGILAVVFASIPVMYSLTTYFFDEEKDHDPGLREFGVYFSIFAGQAVGFMLLAMRYTEYFNAQRSVIGLTGAAVSDAGFISILSNNLAVFLVILVLAAAIGSAGSFVLSWNASVLGVFLAELFVFDPFIILRYLPHTFLEVSGFLIAGVVGTFASASVAREHFDEEDWRRYAILVAVALLLILAGAFLETA
jgi:uncharacterized membrane protein SpoIIM required for sporulation